MSRNWIAVASAEHVRRGRTEGFMQVCHGKAAPLRRIHPGDGVVYYSPTEQYGGQDKLRAFTAIGIVKDVDPYPFERGGGFCPHRRDGAWAPSLEVPFTPVLGVLELSSGGPNWGYQLRFGLFEISGHDLRIIAATMGAVNEWGLEDEGEVPRHPSHSSEIDSRPAAA